MKGMFDALGQLLCLDLPDHWLRGVENEDQGLLVEKQRLDGLQMQLHLVRQPYRNKQRIGLMNTWYKYNNIGILGKRSGQSHRKIHQSRQDPTQYIRPDHNIFTQRYAKLICASLFNIIKTLWDTQLLSQCNYRALTLQNAVLYRTFLLFTHSLR